jgi:hypothetical protein
MDSRKKILIALFSALVLLVAVTLTGCFGDDDGEEGFVGGGYLQK